METTLHRQLKTIYSSDASRQEVRIGGYRIDAVDRQRLVEVQCASLAAIREKIRDLLRSHHVLVVKPLAARKYLINRDRKRGKIISSRYSPIRESYFNLFEDLVHFVDVFGHPRLTLEVVLTEQEEHRVAVRRRRWRSRDYRVEDRRLRAIHDRLQLRSADDLTGLLPQKIQQPFSTEDIAREGQIPRWLAQKMAYCLRKTGAAEVFGKQGNTILYRSVALGREAA